MNNDYCTVCDIGLETERCINCEDMVHQDCCVICEDCAEFVCCNCEDVHSCTRTTKICPKCNENVSGNQIFNMLECSCIVPFCKKCSVLLHLDAVCAD